MHRHSSKVVSVRTFVYSAALTTMFSVLPPVIAQSKPAAPAGKSLPLTNQLPGEVSATIFGTWQGKAPPGSSLGRVVVRIAKSDDGSPHATLIFIDRGATGIPLRLFTYAAPELSFSLSDIDYRGRLSADGKSIEGTWTQGGKPQLLPLTRATPQTLWTYSGPAPLAAMPANADPKFEVTTIKPSNGPREGTRDPRYYESFNYTAKGFIKFGYHLQDRQVIGGPDWMRNSRFDVVGEPDAPGKPSTDQMRTMVRKMLADRFGLKVHMERREFAIYALVVDKPPAKVTPSTLTPDAHTSVYPKQTPDGDWIVQYGWYTMSDFADQLMGWIHSRQIVDETGLKGQFDFTITIPASVLHSGSDSEDTPDADLAHAVEAVGLKLVPKHELLDVVVVDDIEKPSAN